MMTGAGMILGTAAYMSPEQARGKTVDKRADIWAFGVRVCRDADGPARCSTGETISDTLAAVLKTEPDWRALPPATPAAIRRLLRRCLEKDRKRRLDSAADARLEIEEALTAPSATDGPPRNPERRRARRGHARCRGRSSPRSQPDWRWCSYCGRRGAPVARRRASRARPSRPLAQRP